MSENLNQHRVNPFDPTETPESDPVPTGEDIVDRQKHRRDTPRRYDEAAGNAASDDVNTDKPIAP